MIVNIEIGESLLCKVLAECETQGISFEKFVADALRNAVDEPAEPDNDKSRVAETVKKAVQTARTFPHGATFHLDDICAAEDWNAMNGGERKTMGKAFRKAVETSPAIARHVGRTSGNKAIYEKI